jgi:exo-beta-1,3-glucanase (GH17 family)
MKLQSGLSSISALILSAAAAAVGLGLIVIAMFSSVAGATALAPVVSPFAYDAGIDYETFNTTNISADLTAVTQNFGLIRTYHDAAVGTSNPSIPQIDPGEAQVISYVASHRIGGGDIQLVMGTNNNALANGGFGSPWSPGLMTSKSYTDLWVAMVINAFGGVDATKRYLKGVLLGNELDANGPPPTDASFANYYQKWIPESFDNLKASLSAAGLDGVPISTTIANYPLGSAVNLVATSVTDYINANWSPSWNDDKPFVLYNQYTQNGGMSTDFGPVEMYFQNVADVLNNSPQVFVGETGYNAKFGEANEATVVRAIFEWLTQQRDSVGSNVPLFVFQAFDDPAQGQFGLYQRGPYKLKAGITIPSWVKQASVGIGPPVHRFPRF